MNYKSFLVLLVLGSILIAVLFWSQKQYPRDRSGESISDGQIEIRYDSLKFALATSKQQILVTSYIPACDENFDYCFYYKGDEFSGTNFESAGIRVQKRPELSIESSCINTPPSGYNLDKKPDDLKMENAYSSSVFRGVGDAGAGHYASGSLYRLYVKKTSFCYELETRIGQTQFQNYPMGSIKEFAPALQSGLQMQLENILKNITLNGGGSNLFP